METAKNENQFIELGDIFESEVSLEEQEEIMSSKWFNDWMMEYHSY